MAPAGPGAGGREDFEARFEAPRVAGADRPAWSPRFAYLELPGREEARGTCDEAPRRGRGRGLGSGAHRARRGRGRQPPRGRPRDRRGSRGGPLRGLRRTPALDRQASALREVLPPPRRALRLGERLRPLLRGRSLRLYYALRLALYPGGPQRPRGLPPLALRRPLRRGPRPRPRSLRDGPASGSLSAPRPPHSGPGGREPRAAGRARRSTNAAGCSSEMARPRAHRAPRLSFLWFEAGYRAALLLDPVASAFEEHFELLHSLAVRGRRARRCLAAFVAELEPLVGKPDKLEIDLPAGELARRRIMTIHKSKGLEFPVVIVPQANNVGPGLGGPRRLVLGGGARPDLPAAGRDRYSDRATHSTSAPRSGATAMERGRAQAPAVRRPDSRGVAHHRHGHRAPRRGHARAGASAPSSPARPRPLRLALSRSPRADEARARPRSELPPFGRLAAPALGRPRRHHPRAQRPGILRPRCGPRRGEAARGEARGPSPTRPRFPSSSGRARPALLVGERHRGAIRGPTRRP